MDIFPRLEVLTGREKRALAVVALASLAVAAGAIAYVRPAPSARAAAPAGPPRSAGAYIAISPVSAGTAYAATFTGASQGMRGIFRTDDGGRSWRQLAVPVDAFPLGITPLAGQGDAVLFGMPRAGRGGTVQWITHDAGYHWRPVEPPAAGLGGGVQFFPNSSRAFCELLTPMGFSVDVSDDEGSTWRPLIDVAGPDPSLAGVSLRAGAAVGFSGSGLWLMVARPGQQQPPPRLLRSTDQGATWEEIRLPAPPAEYAAEGRANFSLPTFLGDSGYMGVFPSSGAGVGAQWAGSPAAAAYVTTSEDGGATWSPVRSVPHFPVYPVPGDPSWWATDGDRLFTSTDFGLTWTVTRAALPPKLKLQRITRATPRVAWAVYGNFDGGLVSDEPDRTHLLRTTDGGRHWSEVRFPGPQA